jgi:hypothetical protein
MICTAQRALASPSKVYEDEDMHDDTADPGDVGGGKRGKGSFEAHLVMHGAPSEGDDEQFDFSFGWEADFSDDEAEDVHAAFPGATRNKDFFGRPEWLTLSGQGLTEKPSVQGCFLAYHKVSRTWQASYPGVSSMACTHGGTTGRTPEQALLDVLYRMLEVHCSKNKKDKLWALQLSKVTAARTST